MQPRPPRRAEAASPLGALALEAHAGATSFGGIPHAELASGDGARLLIWNAPPVRAELLIRPVHPELPAGMRVDGCVAAVWRVHAQADGAGDVAFRCAWAAEAAPAPGGPSSGQALVAQTWMDESWTVCVGTPDAEGLLCTWRDDGVSLPAAWRARVDGAAPALVVIEEMDDAGITIHLPPLAAGETGQTHFVVAWARTAPDDVSAWFAADMSARIAMGRSRRADPASPRRSSGAGCNEMLPGDVPIHCNTTRGFGWATDASTYRSITYGANPLRRGSGFEGPANSPRRWIMVIVPDRG